MKLPVNRKSRRLVLGPSVLLAVAMVAVVMVPFPIGRADEATSALDEYQERADAAIDKALSYLGRSQLKDGSFPGGMPGNTAVASLCVMAFLGKGYTPEVGPHAEVIDKGVDFVLNCQTPNGMLVGKGKSHGPMYSHCISALMLSEVSGMVSRERQKRLDRALGNALKVILAAQSVKKPPKLQGGWRYQRHSGDSDISCSGWALMTLRSARNNGAAIPKEAIDHAVRFVMNCRNPDGGFAYMPGRPSGLGRTGTGLLCLELSGRHRDDVTVSAGEWILKHLPRKYGAGYFYYALYYCAQGMFQLGGKHWERWAVHMYEMMLKYQQKDGCWPLGTGNESKAGPCYSTAMSVLALSVSYRQLPIYQR